MLNLFKKMLLLSFKRIARPDVEGKNGLLASPSFPYMEPGDSLLVKDGLPWAVNDSMLDERVDVLAQVDFGY